MFKVQADAIDGVDMVNLILACREVARARQDSAESIRRHIERLDPESDKEFIEDLQLSAKYIEKESRDYSALAAKIESMRDSYYSA